MWSVSDCSGSGDGISINLHSAIVVGASNQRVKPIDSGGAAQIRLAPTFWFDNSNYENARGDQLSSLLCVLNLIDIYNSNSCVASTHFTERPQMARCSRWRRLIGGQGGLKTKCILRCKTYSNRIIVLFVELLFISLCVLENYSLLFKLCTNDFCLIHIHTSNYQLVNKSPSISGSKKPSGISIVCFEKFN